MKKDNPFPGMNPYLEFYWPDVHTVLIGYLRDAISEALPDELSARAEEQVLMVEDETEMLGRADVAVSESWRQGVAPSWNPAPTRPQRAVATQPERITLDAETLRHIEIRDSKGRLVTVIEVLSPTNKGRGRDDYLQKRRLYHGAKVNVVEIDLLLGGKPTVMASSQPRPGQTGAEYVVSVTSGDSPNYVERYRCPLREPLPNITVPLRQLDEGIVVALQPLVDRCYRMGSYWNADVSQALPLSPEDAAWVSERLSGD